VRPLAAALLACSLAPAPAGASSAAQSPPPPGVPVFTFHMVDRRLPADRIGNALTITPDQFAAQLRTLAALHVRTMNARDLVASIQHGHIPSRTVVLTFDDGYKDSVTEALPLLRRYHATATFYIISSTIGKPRHLTWADVRTLRRAGMEIGAHGSEHVDLTELNAGGQYAQVDGCRRALRRWADVDPETYAYPSGQYNAVTLAVMRRAHMPAAFTMEYGFVRSLRDPYRLPRIRVLRGYAVSMLRDIATSLVGTRAQ
jgi:peptidoglycan/xylan/chitin deacetylase (PgdA/CDA1 family)